MEAENIQYTHNRYYDHAIILKISAYDFMVISNIKAGENPMQIKKSPIIKILDTPMVNLLNIV